jgi:hypothetical protein
MLDLIVDVSFVRDRVAAVATYDVRVHAEDQVDMWIYAHITHFFDKKLEQSWIMDTSREDFLVRRYIFDDQGIGFDFFIGIAGNLSVNHIWT